MLLMLAHIVCVLFLSISCWQEPKHYEIGKNINVLFLSVRYKRQALRYSHQTMLVGLLEYIFPSFICSCF